MHPLAAKVLSRSLLALAGVLMMFNFIGLLVDPHVDAADGYTGTTAIPGYHYALRGRTQLQSMLDMPMPDFDLNYVNNTVFESLVHSDLRRIQLYENWFLWLGGLVYEPLSRTQVPQRIVSGGAGLCSEVVAVVNRIAGLNNVDARIVALNGHVVSEVLTDHGWQIADPDYGVSFAYNLEALESGAIDNLVRDKLQQVGYGEDVIASYQEFFKTKDNVTLEIGAPSSPRLYQIETLSEWLKWMIPVFLIAAGIAAMRIRKV